MPQLCNKVDRLRAAAYDHLRLARNKLYRYHFDGNYSIFPFELMSSWNIFFFELNGGRNNFIIILRYVDGGIPLRHPSSYFCTFRLFLTYLVLGRFRRTEIRDSSRTCVRVNAHVRTSVHSHTHVRTYVASTRTLTRTLGRTHVRHHVHRTRHQTYALQDH